MKGVLQSYVTREASTPRDANTVQRHKRMKLFLTRKASKCLRFYAGISGPPPGEVVEGLRNPYIDNFLPQRRREASKAYQDYKPIMPKYFHLAMQPDMNENDPDTLDKFLCDLEAVIRSGVLLPCMRLFFLCIHTTVFCKVDLAACRASAGRLLPAENHMSPADGEHES